MKRYVRLVLYVIASVFIPAFAGAVDVEKELSAEFRETSDILARTAQRLKKGEATSEEVARFRVIAERVRASHLILKERFTARREHAMSVSGKAVDRHDAMADRYATEVERYLSKIEAVLEDGILTGTELEELRDSLDRMVHQKKRPIFGALPYKNLSYPAREPGSASAIVPAYKGGNRIVSPEDMEGTTEAPLSKEIAELAQSLQWNPVLIYEWVKNNVATEWYWGGMKGAEETLRQKSGNDADQAALLAALLRSSGFPTRYVRGTIEFFPGIDKVKNLTGIDDPQKVVVFFQRAGIPFKPVVVGGQIANFQIEHIWVESEIPYSNYRGAVIDDFGKTWLALDTSIKPAGVAWNNPLDIVGFPFNTLRDDYLRSVQTTTPLEFIKSKAGEFLSNSNPGKTYQDLLSTKTVIPDVLKIIPSSLQFQSVAITGEYTALPPELMHRITFTATTPAGGELFTTTLDASRISNQRLALSYEPETVEDQQIIDSYGGLDNTPSYLVRLRPVLKLNGERLIVSQDGLPMGAEYSLAIDVITPNGTERIGNSHIVGNLAVISVVAQQTTQNNILTENDDAETILFKEANGYISRWNQAEDELAALLKLAVGRPLPTVVTVGGLIDVTWLLGIPHGFEWKGVFIDAALRGIETVSRVGDASREKTFMRLSSLQGSVLENRIFEDAFKVDSVSTAKLMAQANDSATQLITIDATNIYTLLPSLPFDDDTKTDITNAVNQNLIVTIPPSEMTYMAWTGIGYIKENPVTGESGWMLSGMVAGGMTVWSPAQWDSQADKVMSVALRAPFRLGKPNYDPQQAASLVKIPVTDRQFGVVGTKLGTSLEVKVLDANFRPVVGAGVTFTIKSGGGILGDKGETFVRVVTDGNGIAKAALTLGQKTSDNPVFIFTEGTTFTDQYGGNVVDAVLDSGIAITTPFTAYAAPGPVANLRKTYGDQKTGQIHSFAGFVSLSVEDSYGNPIANKPINFKLGTPVDNSQCVLANSDLTPSALVKAGDSCVKNFPTTADLSSCTTAAQAITDISSVEGAIVQVILGGSPETSYPIKAQTQIQTSTGTKTLETTFTMTTQPYGNCSGTAEPSYQLSTAYVYRADAFGNNINAARSGSTILLQARLYALKEGKKTIDEKLCTLTCPKIVGDRTYSVGTDFTASSALFDGKPSTNLGGGRFQHDYVLKPGLNTIRIDGLAEFDIQRTNNTCSGCSGVLTQKQSLNAFTTMQFYGVDIAVKQPLRVMLTPDGYTRNNLKVSYTIAPAEYQALSAGILLYKNNVQVAYVPSETTGSGFGTIARGYLFDENAKYDVQVVLNYATGVQIVSELIPITIAKGALIPDYNHNRKIDQEDIDRAMNGDTYYFWVNDDDGNGDTEGTGIPGTGSAVDPSHLVVDGTRDLIDFFPVHLDILRLIITYDPATYLYRLRNADSALNYVITDLGPANSGDYLTGSNGTIEPAKTLATAPTLPISSVSANILTAPYIALKPEVLNAVKQGKGVILVEGYKPTQNPLTLEVYDKDLNKVFETSLNLSIDGVEQMFRHKNLMRQMYQIEQQFPGIIPPGGVLPVAGHPVPNEGVPDRLTASDFSNQSHFIGFDAENDNKVLVHVHGYNVNGQDARGEQSEVFKRLYWSGSKAKFWGITWYGYDSQDDKIAVLIRPIISKRSGNYHVNVRHAFNAGKLLNVFVKDNGLGEATFSAHSLGNMVVSTAVQQGMPYYRYIMANPAVAEEAYTPEEEYSDVDSNNTGKTNWETNTRALMYHPLWAYPDGNENNVGYKPFLWAAEWYKLFSDDRRKLTWRNRFSKVREGNRVFVFFSPTDEVFRPYMYDATAVGAAQIVENYPRNINNIPGFEDVVENYSLADHAKLGTYAFAFQELFKGRVDILIEESFFGGWGFNFDDYFSVVNEGKIQEANNIPYASLSIMPFFKKNPKNTVLYSDTPVRLTDSKIEELLANEIPALTFAVGHRGIGYFEKMGVKRNIDIRDRYLKKKPNAPWVRPTDKYVWLHSDIFNVSYPYVRLMYDDWVKVMNGGELQ